MATSNAKKSSSPGRTKASSNRSTPKGTGSRSRTTTSAPRRSSGGQGHKKTGGQSYLTRDILLLFLIAFAVLLFLSLFGLIGAVGRVLASFEFGLFGRLAYVFPFIFFFLVVFTVSNFEKYPLNTLLRVVTAILTFSLLCGIIELIGSGGEVLPKLKDYYALGKGYRVHGGWFGGFWCRLLLKAMGRVGSYVVMLVLFLAGLVFSVGKALLTAAGLTGKRVTHAIRDESARYREASREKRQIAEMRAEERLQRRAIEREAKAQRQGEERRALMEQLDRKLEAGRKNMLELTKLELNEVKKKPVSQKTEPGRTEAKNRQRSLFDDTDLTTPALPKDTSIQRLFDEMESHRKGAVKKEDRTLDELTDAFDEFDRSLGKKNRKEPRIRISQGGEERLPAAETAVIEEVPAQEALKESEMAPVWEDPRKQVDKMHLDELFQADAKPKQEEVLPVETEPVTDEEILTPIQELPEQEVFVSPAVPQSGEPGEEEALRQPAKREFRLPSTNLLKRAKNNGTTKESDLKNTARLLEETLRNFGVEVTVTDISCGPSVTRYELRPEQGVKVARISSLADDIKLALAATEIRIEAPIPGKSAVGIEVPNPENQTVSLRSIIESEEFNRINSKIAFAVGQDIGGRVVVADLAKMPHLLIAGATGSGKSVCINSLIMSILYRAKPDEVQMIMIDPKVVELGEYNGIPHLRIPVVTDPKLAAEALNGAVKEMTARYKKFADLNVKDIKGYNAKIRDNPEEYADHEPMPQIVVIVDEFADLMMVAPGDVEQSVCRLAQLARAAGIHLVVATQRPSVNVITGLIKANIQSRIALAVSSGIDSRTIIDMNGAEKLLGKGDMLFYPTGYPKPVRVQGCWVSEEETEAVTKFWKKQNAVSEEQLVQQNKDWMPEPLDKTRDFKDERDELFMEAAEYIIENEKASIGNLQRVFRIGFNRAARLMDQLAEAGIVGKDDGTKARQIQMDRAQFEEWKRQ